MKIYLCAERYLTQNMQTDAYRENLIELVNKLVDIRKEIFDQLFKVAITGELKEWADDVPVGDSFNFTKDIFTGCTDTNMQLLVKLLNDVEGTVDSLCNLNRIEFPIKQQGEEND